MNHIDNALLVCALTLATALWARRLSTPLPVVLAAAGIAFGVLWRFVPWLPPVALPPDRVLLVFLPPLLATAAYSLPLSAFRASLWPIVLLAVGLVLATLVVTAVVAHSLGGLPWAAAFILGAIVSPPDAVAVTTVAGGTGLPHRLVVILEGEGLLNDAVAITAYGLAVTAALSGEFSARHALLALAREAPTGVVIGLVAGWLFVAVRRRVVDVTIEAGLSILTPYVTYEVADRLGASAVLAVVTFGLVLQRKATGMATVAARLGTRTVWSILQFVSTALVFLLLGVLMGELASVTVSAASVRLAVAVATAAIVLRFAWLFTVPRLIRMLPGLRRSPLPPWRELTILGWAGMRGVVSLALALALPRLTTHGGAGGTDLRGAIITGTLGVILATLVLQGLTLVPAIRWLGVGDPEREQRDEHRVRARARRAGLSRLDRLSRTDGLAADDCQRLGGVISGGYLGVAVQGSARKDHVGALLSALEAERKVVVEMHDAGRISASVADRLVTELDTDMLRLRGDAGRLTSSD